MRRIVCKALKGIVFGSLLFLAACEQESIKNEGGIPTSTLPITDTVTLTMVLQETLVPTPKSTVPPELTAIPMPTATEPPMLTPLADIPLTEEYFPDANFQKYLYEYVDTNKDRILTLEEREAVLRIQNDFADYDKDALWNEGYADVVYEGPGYDEYLVPLSKVANLQGIEYFSNLYEIQLEGVDLDMEELVITNPKLEIFCMFYQGNVKNINLTDCEKLRTCVVRCCSEMKPIILLPEPLEVRTLEKVHSYGTTYFDCVIGETAWDWLSGEYRNR